MKTLTTTTRFTSSNIDYTNKYFTDPIFKDVYGLPKYQKHVYYECLSTQTYKDAIANQAYERMRHSESSWKWTVWFTLVLKEEKDYKVYLELKNQPINSINLDYFYYKKEPTNLNIPWLYLFNTAYYKDALHSLSKHLDAYRSNENLYFLIPAFVLNKEDLHENCDEVLIKKNKAEWTRIFQYEPILTEEVQLNKRNLHTVYLMLWNLYKTIKTVLDIYKKTDPDIYSFIESKSPLTTTLPLSIETVTKFLNDPQTALNEDLVNFLYRVYVSYCSFSSFLADIVTLYPLNSEFTRNYLANQTILENENLKQYFSKMTSYAIKDTNLVLLCNIRNFFDMVNKDDFALASIDKKEGKWTPPSPEEIKAKVAQQPLYQKFKSI